MPTYADVLAAHRDGTETAASTSSASATHDEPDGARQGTAKRKRAKKNRFITATEGTLWPWNDSLGMAAYESKEQRLHDEIVAYVSYIIPTDQERRAREKIVTRVRDVVRKRFPKANLAMFGSTAQNLNLPDSDIDLAMTVPGELDFEARKRVLFQLSAALNNSLLTRDSFVRHRARVPIISLTTVPELGSFKVDISVNSTDGVKAVPIIKDYIDKMPALRYLVMVLKGYMSRLRLNNASEGGLSGYSIICLAISFLQLNPKKIHLDEIEKPLERESLGRLVLAFLDYYGNEFDYEDSCISITNGGLVSKEDRGWQMPSLPEHLSIECLVNPDHDIGRPTGKIKQVRTAFREAHYVLHSYPFAITHSNILGTILGISPEVRVVLTLPDFGRT
ncbi:Nucleotidyltransferase [Laetiporus sulphureus 93-53]|uniref:polynucleotide adenylyltransferase n=1 Tax=Laetiporus sulphureus 93-53 TaxID=1314785 RepID=A0A165BJH4_9APHY|nr:Nucleotidyltransferase [Laetiporus sulphureus 93-53]KZT01176.1 Nucleotidyltransferase [Laetiporus sulphureus 93-53]